MSTYNFGPTSTTFAASPYTPESLLAETRRQLAEEKLAKDSWRRRAEVAEAAAMIAKAKAEAGEPSVAERRAQIAVNALKTVHEQVRATMSDPHQDYARLEERIAELERERSEKGVENRRLDADLKAQRKAADEELKSKDEELKSKTDELQKLAKQVETLKTELDESRAAEKHTVELLDKAYADTRAVESERDSALDARDELEVKKADTELKLASLRKEWEDQQDRIEELENAQADFDALQNQLELLREETEIHQKNVSDKDNFIKAKDQRIDDLEKELQQYIVQKHQNEAKAEEAKSPVALPEVLSSQDQSLEAELDGIDEELSNYSDEEPNEFVGYIPESAIETAPISPVRPTLSATTAVIDTAPIDIAPMALTLSAPSAVIETAPIESSPATLHLSEVTSIESTPVEVVPALPSFSAISAVATAPVEISTTDSDTQTKSAPLEFSALSTISTAPIEVSVADSETQTEPQSLNIAAISPIFTYDSETPTDTVSPKSPTSYADISTQTDIQETTTLDEDYVIVSPDPNDHTSHHDIYIDDGISTQPSSRAATRNTLLNPLALFSAAKNATLLTSFLMLALSILLLAASDSAGDPFAGAYGSPRYLFGVIPIGTSMANAQLSGFLFWLEDVLGVEYAYPH
jgi:hypothetical protein